MAGGIDFNSYQRSNMGLTIGFESISQVMFKVCFSAALITLPSYWHVGGSVCNAEVGETHLVCYFN